VAWYNNQLLLGDKNEPQGSYVHSHVFSVCWSLPSRRCSICLGSSTVAVVCPSSLGIYCIPLQVSWAPSKDRQNCRLQNPTITRTQYTHCLCPVSVLRTLAQFNDGKNLNSTIIRKHNDIISTKTWSRLGLPAVICLCSSQYIRVDQ